MNYTTRRKAETSANGAALIVGALLGVAGAIVAEAWLLMLILGAVHSVIAFVPAVGLGTAILLLLGAYWLTVFVRRLFRRK